MDMMEERSKLREETVLPTSEERELPEFNAMQRVKRRFFAMRNGDLAQQMADRGARYRINFGLNMPQISDIARDFLAGGCERESLPETFDMADFARRLRDNRSTRESMLIAPMLFPVEDLTQEEALEWAKSVATPEIADVLCLKLLRNFRDAPGLMTLLMNEDDALSRYVGLRLGLNLLQSNKVAIDSLLHAVEMEESRGVALTASVCRQLRDEISFMTE